MNTDILKGNWSQLKGKIKENWGQLTDDEIDQVEGSYDGLVGRLQEKYGIEKEESRNRVNKFLKKFNEKNN